MRYILDLSLPALLSLIGGLVLAIHFDLTNLGFALIMGPVLFLVDALDEGLPSSRKGFQLLTFALVMFPIGLLASYWVENPFTDVLNKTDSGILRRLLGFPISFAIAGLLQLLTVSLLGDRQDPPDA